MKTELNINLTAEEYLEEETRKSFDEFRQKILGIFDDYEYKLNKERDARFFPIIKM